VSGVLDVVAGDAAGVEGAVALGAVAGDALADGVVACGRDRRGGDASPRSTTEDL